MAHGPQCFGTWRNSKLGSNPDGKIKIDFHITNKITGTHENTGFPIEGTCTDGKHQDFTRKKEQGSNKKIHYKGDITVLPLTTHIKGKFNEESVNAKSRTKKDKKTNVAPDDWTAEKPT